MSTITFSNSQSGMVFDECARCAVLLHGGNGFTQSGQGEIVESVFHLTPCMCIEHVLKSLSGLYREVNGIRIPGMHSFRSIELRSYELNGRKFRGK